MKPPEYLPALLISILFFSFPCTLLWADPPNGTLLNHHDNQMGTYSRKVLPSKRLPSNDMRIRIFKRPPGSLIYPETNDPRKTDEVYLLASHSTPSNFRGDLHLHYGVQFLSRQKYSQARRELLRAAALGSNELAIQKHLGVVYLNTKNFRKAETAYRKALELDPAYTPAIAKLGICFIAQKKYRQAETQFKKAIKADPTNDIYHRDLGHLYFYVKKNYRMAQVYYKRALKLNPRLKKVRANLGEIARKFEKWKDQEKDFDISQEENFNEDMEVDSERAEDPDSSNRSAKSAEARDAEDGSQPLF